MCKDGYNMDTETGKKALATWVEFFLPVGFQMYVFHNSNNVCVIVINGIKGIFNFIILLSL
jgi:hypothetical protein